MREGWRRRPDLNRGWRFCRAIPGHFHGSEVWAIAPEIPPAQSHASIGSPRSSCAALADIGRRELAAGTVRAQLSTQPETGDRIPLGGVGSYAIQELLIEEERFPVERVQAHPDHTLRRIAFFSVPHWIQLHFAGGSHVLPDDDE
jgi:hypothetical protein